MSPSFRAVALSACCVLALSACKTSDFAKGGGAALGAVLGSQIGSGKGRLVGIVIGAGLGYLAGSALGDLLDENEQAEVTQTSADALETADDGATVSWANPNTGKTADVTVKDTRTVARETTIVRQKDVMPAPAQLILINEPYVAVKNSNVRKGPNTSYDRSGFLVTGDEIDVVGRVSNTDWLMVARDGVTVGYVYEPLLRRESGGAVLADAQSPVTDEEDSFTTVSNDSAPRLAKVGKEAAKPQMREPYDLDTLNLDQDLAVESVAVQSECRDLEIQVDANGNKATETGTACKAPDGAWELVDLELDDAATSS